MADISKLKIEGIVYDIKDVIARNGSYKETEWIIGTSSLDDYKVSGLYYFDNITRGDDYLDTDGFPVLNSGKFDAKLNVLNIGSNASQILYLQNDGGGDFNVYTRYCDQNTGWEPWGKLQTNIEVGQVNSLDNFIDNGIYSGVLTDGTSSSVGSFYDTFILIVINNYAVSKPLGRAQGISQLKYSLGLDGMIVKVETRTRYSDGVWTSWSPVSNDVSTANDTTPGIISENRVRELAGTVKVEWNNSSNLNDYRTSGVYEIYGERTNTDDNLPINNSNPGHSISARLTVASSTLQPDNAEISVTQFLMLSNRTGGDGNIYIRSYNENNSPFENGWTSWKKVSGVIEDYLGNKFCSDTKHYIFSNNSLEEVEGDGLMGFIDNGSYAGVYCQNIEIVIQNAMNAGLTDQEQLINYILQNAVFETYNLQVVNDYSLANLLNKNRHITQVKTAIDTTNGRSVIKKRLGTGNNTITWTDWEEICDSIYDLGTLSTIGKFEEAAFNLSRNPRITTMTALINTDDGKLYRATMKQNFKLTIGDNENFSIAETYQYLHYIDGYRVRRITNGLKGWAVQGGWMKTYLNNMRDITSFVNDNSIEICQVTPRYCADDRGSYNKGNENIDTLVTIECANSSRPGLMSKSDFNNLTEAANFLTKLKTAFGTTDLDTIVNKLASLK